MNAMTTTILNSKFSIPWADLLFLVSRSAVKLIETFVPTGTSGIFMFARVIVADCPRARYSSVVCKIPPKLSSDMWLKSNDVYHDNVSY